jgi:DNA-binding transcriptional regulator YiaG
MHALLDEMATLGELTRQIEVRRELPPPAVRRALRKAAGASLADVAAVVGVTDTAVAYWETGARSPRARNLETYLEVLRAFRQVVASPPEHATAPAPRGGESQGRRQHLTN